MLSGSAFLCQLSQRCVYPPPCLPPKPLKLKLAIFMCWCPLVRIFRSRGSYGPVTPAGSSVNTQSFASHLRERQFPARHTNSHRTARSYLPVAPHLPPRQSVERAQLPEEGDSPNLPHCGRAWRGAAHTSRQNSRAAGGGRGECGLLTALLPSFHQAHQAGSISYSTDTRTRNS